MTDLGLHHITERTAGFGTATLRLAEAAATMLGGMGAGLMSTLRTLSRASEAYGKAYTTLLIPPDDRQAGDEERY